MRLMVIAAHPDDAEFHAGGLMARFANAGHKIQICCVTDGAAGHQHHGRELLAKIRINEANRAAALINAELVLLDEPDGELTPNIRIRKKLIGCIRAFRPDLIVTHRTNDYHPDHRATAQLVQDACYLVRVPRAHPDTQPLTADPVVLAVCDFFQQPNPFRADLTLDITPEWPQILQMLNCHESQVYEWLPHTMGIEVTEPKLAWLEAFYSPRPERVAKIHLPSAKRAEAYQLSEYGKQLSQEQLQSYCLGPIV